MKGIASRNCIVPALVPLCFSLVVPFALLRNMFKLQQVPTRRRSNSRRSHGKRSSSSSAKRLKASTNDKYSLGKQNVRGIISNCFANFPPKPVKRCRFFFNVSFRVNSLLPGKWFTRWKWNNDSYLIRGRDHVHNKFHVRVFKPILDGWVFQLPIRSAHARVTMSTTSCRPTSSDKP